MCLARLGFIKENEKENQKIENTHTHIYIHISWVGFWWRTYVDLWETKWEPRFMLVEIGEPKRIWKFTNRAFCRMLSVYILFHAIFLGDGGCSGQKCNQAVRKRVKDTRWTAASPSIWVLNLINNQENRLKLQHSIHCSSRIALFFHRPFSMLHPIETGWYVVSTSLKNISH